MPRCKCCKEKFDPKVFNQKFCMAEDKCIRAYLVWVSDKMKQEKKKKWNAEKKVMKEKLKTLGDYEREARVEFQRFIRLRDKDLPCISCSITNAQTTQWDAGHYLKAELFSGLIFAEFNCHKQCKQCNHRKSGNELAYRDGLIERYGKDYLEAVESIKNEHRVCKYTKEELIAIKLKYKTKIKTIISLTPTE